MKKLLLFVLLLSITVLPAQAQDDLTDINVFMPFIPNIQFAPVYVAMEKGYFADAGLNINLEYGSEPDGLELIASGGMDYGFISGEQVILARSNDRPVVYTYEWYQRNPIAVVTPPDIVAPGQLEGMTVGVPGRFGATYISLTALLSSAGLTEDDIDLQEIGFNAPEVMCVGGVEAAAVYINNEPLQIRSRIDEGDCGDVGIVEVIPVADYADLVSNGIVTSEAKISDQPEQVAAFIQAFDRALFDTISNPMEAYMLSVPHIEGLPYENPDVFESASEEINTFLADTPPMEAVVANRNAAFDTVSEQLADEERVQLEVLMATLNLYGTQAFGVTDTFSWELTQDVLLAMGFITAPLPDLDAAYTNEFVPAEPM